MKRLLLLFLLLITMPALGADTGLLLAGVSGGAAASTYTGPGDQVSSAAGWWSCSFGYNGAYATGSNKACKVRRASDSTTQDINILSNGNFDVASYNTFVGTDATGSCTIASTTLTCTGLGSTLTAKDLITGVGITNPCILSSPGSLVGGAQTATAQLAGTSTSCGTVSVAETVVAQVAGFVTEAYDQTGNNLPMLQATAGNQPQLLPLCLTAGTLPCVWFLRASSQSLTNGPETASAQPVTFSTVVSRVGSTSSAQTSISSGSNVLSSWSTSANTVELYAGSVATVGSIADGSLHAIEAIYSGASSVAYIDGTAHSSLNAGTNGVLASAFTLGNDGFNDFFSGYMGEAGYWPLGFSGTNDKNMCTNKSTRYGLGLTCN